MQGLEEYHFIFLLDDSGSMDEMDGTSKTRWQKVVDSVEAFISKRKQIALLDDDLVSVIYYSNDARIVCNQVKLDQVKQKMGQANNQFSGTFFCKAIQEIKNVINANIKTMVLFLSDGQDAYSTDLENEMKYIKNNYYNLICRWWNIGFGPDAKSEAMEKMVNIMQSDKCDAQFKQSLIAEDLIENFEQLASDDKMNF